MSNSTEWVLEQTTSHSSSVLCRITDLPICGPHSLPEPPFAFLGNKLGAGSGWDLARSVWYLGLNHARAAALCNSPNPDFKWRVSLGKNSTEEGFFACVAETGSKSVWFVPSCWNSGCDCSAGLCWAQQTSPREALSYQIQILLPVRLVCSELLLFLWCSLCVDVWTKLHCQKTGRR